MALLTVLSQPAMARAMGAAAARRARDLFAPELVMAAHEELFSGVGGVPPSGTARCPFPRPVSPQLDPCVCLLTLHLILHPPFNPPAFIHELCRDLCVSSELRFGKSWRNPCQIPSAAAWRETLFANINSNGVRSAILP